ncbi:protoporphyrinogen oxidase HemJ [Faunimonas sp. B44]|uniref:protoporphyrinogen oxidase HemJ n=1 Tax=Faunimonas sp. B44 TaxID=3461493 RepID=UPI004044108B
MLWVKAAHVVSIIAWMAALLYLPRLLVYHCDAPPGSDRSETFKVMERRLLKAIAIPAMISSYLFGIWMAVLLQPWSEAWFWAKIALVVALTVFHEQLAAWVRAFAHDANTRPARFYRIANEVPTLIMIAIVILVVVKPF